MSKISNLEIDTKMMEEIIPEALAFAQNEAKQRLKVQKSLEAAVSTIPLISNDDILMEESSSPLVKPIKILKDSVTEGGKTRKRKGSPVKPEQKLKKQALTPNRTELESDTNAHGIDKKEYPNTVPKMTWSKSSSIPQFFKIFKALSGDQKLIVDHYIKFQVDSALLAISKTNDEHINKLYDEIEKLTQQLNDLTNQIDPNKDMTNFCSLTTTPVRTVCPTTSSDIITSPQVTDIPVSTCKTSGSTISEKYSFEKIKNISIMALTQSGLVKVKIGQLPGFSNKILQALNTLKMLEFLMIRQNRESGDSYLLIIHVVLKLKPTTKLSNFHYSEEIAAKAILKYNNYLLR